MPDSGLIVSLLGGLVIMAFAGDFLVNGAVACSRRLGLSPLIAGIFIVGFGTSAPEMLVALDAARNNYPNLALGNIVGSNIANILLVLALPAIISPIVTGGWGQGRSFIAMLLITLAWIAILGTVGLDVAVGTLFLIALVLYAVFTLVSARMATKAGVDTGIDVEVGIARFYSIREELIGLTLLAVGTSLPEIGAGIAAAVRNKTDVLVGNVLGSNIFNILGAGGFIAFFGPIDAAQSFFNYDHWVMAAAALIVGLFIFAKMRIGRLAGLLLLLIYAVYIYGLVNGWNISALLNV